MTPVPTTSVEIASTDGVTYTQHEARGVRIVSGFLLSEISQEMAAQAPFHVLPLHRNPVDLPVPLILVGVDLDPGEEYPRRHLPPMT